ncbi:MAG TPA: vWA domain-containing protein [Gemmatimonadales bacterium]|nr:vWA domain-containing protein [Gemmatimonadales bacterium]
MSFVMLRVAAVLALILLLWNPASSRLLPAGDQPIVLLDASLSMTGAPWRAALDSARGFARPPRRAIVWRFGNGIAPFDTAAPAGGASHLGPALEAAAGRAGEVIVVTDGNVDDVAGIPADLLRRPRVIVQPRPSFFDAYVASVEGVRHVTRGDTVRLRVSYGSAGTRETRNGTRETLLTVGVGDRRLASQRVMLPDSGTISTEITFPVSRIPFPGWSVLEVRLDGVGDAEPRDDVRLLVVDVSVEPAAVIFASPPDWEARFLARTLSDVARVPVKVFVETEPGRWRDGATLAPVATAELTRAAAGARLVIATGDPARARAFTSGARAARLLWPTNGQAGDWYVERPLSSPLTAALAGVLWDSLPPATAAAAPAAIPRRDSNPTLVVALSARLARRGPPRPILMLEQQNGGGQRQATVTAAGLWRWAFRGGAAEEAYRSLVAAVVDWLLGERGAGSRERASPEELEVPNGLPIVWRWSAYDDPRALAVTLRSGDSTRTDTLRFDAAGRAELLLPPGVYRYALSGGPEQGVVAVETYSDEWLPSTPSLGLQPGEATARLASIGLRDRWWLFVIAIAALATEWALRRRQGLP